MRRVADGILTQRSARNRTHMRCRGAPWPSKLRDERPGTATTSLSFVGASVQRNALGARHLSHDTWRTHTWSLAMFILETLKRTFAQVSGRPTLRQARNRVAQRRPKTFTFRDDGRIPNNPTLPFVVYRGAVRV